MKMLKRAFCLVLALALLLSACALAQSDTQFEPTLTNIVDSSADRWYSTSYNRALLTVLLLLDCDELLVEGDLLDTTGAVVDTTYVGRGDSVLVAYYHAVDGDLIIMYNPETGIADYMVLDSYDEAKAEFFMESICPDGYYENNISDVMTVGDDLMEILESD